MALANGLRIIWLDTHIGVVGEYKTFKNQFQSNLQPIISMPPGNINELLFYFEEHVAPIKFVSTIEDALHSIELENDKRIIFISSGVLGKEIISNIISNYTNVYSFYIFCGYIRGLVDWALENEYETCMKMFDHETDLLIRLVRDSSNDIIRAGRAYMQLDGGESARKCFVTAETLEISANEIDKPNRPCLLNLRLLQGGNGLIQQARNMR